MPCREGRESATSGHSSVEEICGIGALLATMVVEAWRLGGLSLRVKKMSLPVPDHVNYGAVPLQQCVHILAIYLHTNSIECDQAFEFSIRQ